MNLSSTPAFAAPGLLRRMPLFVWIPIVAAALLLIGHSLTTADEIEEVLLVSGGVVLLAGGHALLRARARSVIVAREAERAQEELSLRSQVQECQQQRKSLKAFAEVASHVAHEIRTPLSSIILNVELLDEEATRCGCENVAESRALIASIQREAERLQHLTDEYLAFARPPLPRVGYHSLNSIVDDLVHRVRAEASRAGVAVTVDLSRECPCARLDPQQILQAAWNLVRNALQAMPGGGRLALSTHVGPSGGAALVVDDTGPGIPHDLRCRALEPFFTTKPNGSGLGLPLSAHLVRDHGGELELGDAPGGGARVTLRFPPTAPEPGSCGCGAGAAVTASRVAEAQA